MEITGRVGLLRNGTGGSETRRTSPEADTKLYVLKAQQRSPYIHNFRNRGIRDHPKHVETVRESCCVAGVTSRELRRCTRRRSHGISGGEPALWENNRRAILFSPRWRGSKSKSSLHISTPHLGEPGCEVKGLPLPEQLVEPGMVKIKDGISRARNGVRHLLHVSIASLAACAMDSGDSYLAADTAMSTPMRSVLGTQPKVHIRHLLETKVEVLLPRHHTDGVVDEAIDAVQRVSDSVAGAEVVCKVGKGSINNAPICSHSVSTESRQGIENIRLVEISSVPRLVPVPANGESGWKCPRDGQTRFALTAVHPCTRTHSAAAARGHTCASGEKGGRHRLRA